MDIVSSLLFPTIKELAEARELAFTLSKKDGTKDLDDAIEEAYIMSKMRYENMQIKHLQKDMNQMMIFNQRLRKEEVNITSNQTMIVRIIHLACIRKYCMIESGYSEEKIDFIIREKWKEEKDRASRMSKDELFEALGYA